MPTFSIPLSGLNASAQALSVVANNLANLNTVGYKDQRATFQDLFYQTLGTNGSGEPIQIGAGAAVGSISSSFGTGNIESTGVPTDVAISGDGFFVTRQDQQYVFTRAGDFTVNDAGELSTQSGEAVMGYPVVNGSVVTSQGLATVQLGKGQLSAPAATTWFQARMNLNANAAVGDTYSAPVSIYDSLGNAHVLTANFTKAAPNQWDYSLAVPAAEVGQPGVYAVLKTGSVSFDQNGNLLSPSTDVAGTSIQGLADGAAAVQLTWRLYDPTTGAALLTQTAAPSSTASTNQDGYGSGTLTNFTIGKDGIVQGTFSNGRTMAVGQIVLANFADVQGLQRLGSNSYLPTLSSGAAVIGTPGSSGRGTLTGGALELSNVDIAQEFSKMIINQRGYQANARVVTTFDEITQDTINLKR